MLTYLTQDRCNLLQHRTNIRTKQSEFRGFRWEFLERPCSLIGVRLNSGVKNDSWLHDCWFSGVTFFDRQLWLELTTQHFLETKINS